MMSGVVFRGIAAKSYYNAALGASAVEVLAGVDAVINAASLAAPGVRYPTHVRVTNSHATQVVGALVADTGDAALTSGNFSCVIMPQRDHIMPLSQAKRCSVIASGANTPVSVEFGTIG